MKLRHIGAGARCALRNGYLRALLAAVFVAGLTSSPVLAAQSIATNLPGIRAVLAPPTDFNPIVASDAELENYALPPRPDRTANPAGYGLWERAMSRVNLTPYTNLTQTNRYHGSLKTIGSPSGNTYNSSNWSGYAVTTPNSAYASNASYYVVSQEFVVPSVTDPTCGTKQQPTYAYAALWAGLDGFSNSPHDVLQAGAALEVSCGIGGPGSGPNVGVVTPTLWIEWANNAAIDVTPFNVSIGDDIVVWVWTNPAAATPTTGYAYIGNLKTGVGAEYTLSIPTGETFIGNSAEWIVEAPMIGGNQSVLADYGTAQFVNSYVQLYNSSGPDEYCSSSGAYEIIMKQVEAGQSETVSTPSCSNTSTITFTY